MTKDGSVGGLRFAVGDGGCRERSAGQTGTNLPIICI
jgi:hypothetical protein